MNYDDQSALYVHMHVYYCMIFAIQKPEEISTVCSDQSLDTHLNEMVQNFSAACQNFTSVMAIKHHLQYFLFSGTDTLKIPLQNVTDLLKLLQTQSKLFQKVEVSMQLCL